MEIRTMFAVYPLSLCVIVSVAVLVREVLKERRSRQSQRCQKLLVGAIRQQRIQG